MASASLPTETRLAEGPRVRNPDGVLHPPHFASGLAGHLHPRTIELLSMPVKPTKERNPRSIMIGLGLFSAGIMLILGLFVLAIPKLTESGKIEVKLGTDKFDAGYVRSKALEADIQPLLFSDVSGGQRDIFLVHLGTDPLTGWLAFDARKPGQGRECPLDWVSASASFTDRCDGSFVSGDGAGLPSYPVEVTKDEHVVIDLKADQRGTTTTATIQVTGSIPK